VITICYDIWKFLRKMSCVLPLVHQGKEGAVTLAVRVGIRRCVRGADRRCRSCPMARTSGLGGSWPAAFGVHAPRR
jgi:hypothetical protein